MRLATASRGCSTRFDCFRRARDNRFSHNACISHTAGKRSKRGRLSEGATTLRTKALTDSIAESISLGLTDEESALIAGIKPETLSRWRRVPEFDQA
jgi:hypothetical protein